MSPGPGTMSLPGPIVFQCVPMPSGEKRTLLPTYLSIYGHTASCSVNFIDTLGGKVSLAT